MAFSENYRRQAALLIRTLPSVAEEQVFALKGGTAINLFVRDMPRLSVDIDLTYLPIQSYEDSLDAIDASLKRIAGRIRKTLPAAAVAETRLQSENKVTKLLVRADGAQIKLEVTPVLRGSVYKSENRAVSPAVERAFGFAEIQVVSFADLYGGKIIAALDRQHPRDFFDIRQLLATEGIDDSLRRAVIVYLLSHNRPMAEVLKPRLKDIRQEFERGFQGMTVEPVTLDDLLAARDALIGLAVGKMPEQHKRFLISFEEGNPDWDLLGLPLVPELPAVLWRQTNLDKLKPKRRAELVSHLKEALGIKSS